jgi:hypothetical protein
MSSVVKRNRRAYRRFTKIDHLFDAGCQGDSALVEHCAPVMRTRTASLDMIDPGRKSGARPRDKSWEARCAEVNASAHRLNDQTASNMCQLTDVPACRRTLISEYETTCNSRFALGVRA